MSFAQISTAPTNPRVALINTGVKRRRDASKDAIPSPVKRKKSVDAREQSTLRQPRTSNLGSHSRATKERKGNEASKKKTKPNQSPASSDDEDADAGLEEAYERKVRLGKQVATASSRNKEQLRGSSDSEGETSQLVHETTVKKDRRSRTRPRQVHNAPLDETKAERDARTIFLGNVPMEVAKGKVCAGHLSPMIALISQIASLPSTNSNAIYFRMFWVPR
jgi:nucleolar protein 12